MEVVPIFLYECIVIRFGYPLDIMIDQGTNFINKVVESLTNRFAIKHREETTYK